MALGSFFSSIISGLSGGSISNFFGGGSNSQTTQQAAASTVINNTAASTSQTTTTTKPTITGTITGTVTGSTSTVLAGSNKGQTFTEENITSTKPDRTDSAGASALDQLVGNTTTTTTSPTTTDSNNFPERTGRHGSRRTSTSSIMEEINNTFHFEDTTSSASSSSASSTTNRSIITMDNLPSIFRPPAASTTTTTTTTTPTTGNILQELANANKPDTTVTEAIREPAATTTTTPAAENILQELANANKPETTVTEAIRESITTPEPEITIPETTVSETIDTNALKVETNKIAGGSTTRTDNVANYIDIPTGEVKQPAISETIGLGIEATADLIKDTGNDIKLTGEVLFTDPQTGKVTNAPLLDQMESWDKAGVSYEKQIDAFVTTAGVAAIPAGLTVGAGTKIGAAAISKLPAAAKETAKAAAGFTVGGGLAGVGGETEFSKETSKVSSELKELAGTLTSTADTPAEIIGSQIAAVGLGVAGSVVDTFGALSSAQKGAAKIAGQLAEVPNELATAITDVATGKELSLEGVAKPLTTFGQGVVDAEKGLIDWAKNAGNTPAYSLGEIAGIGGIFKGVKTAAKLPDTIQTGIIREAQADITGSLSQMAGLDRTATEKAFKAAGNTVELAQSLDVPLISKNNVPLKELTMFEDIDKQTLGKLETSLANAEVVNYGTTANVLFGLDFRKTSDFDASVPAENAVKLVNDILKDTKAYETRPSKPIIENAQSYQIERPSPQTGQYAHMFDLKKLEPVEDGIQSPYDLSTSTYPRTPTKESQYLKIKPEGATNALKVEPLEYALSRKYAAVYFPRTDKLADNMGDIIAPKTIEYQTKIDLESYKTGIVTDLDKKVTRSVPITGAGFAVARAAGVPTGLLAKLKTGDTKALGTINQKINYPIELGDSHRMKDALDLIGITWEYQNKLSKRGTVNPVKAITASRKFGKNLDTMLKDDYLKAQARTGAKDKLSDLSPAFAGYLQSKGILTDAQLKRVMSTATRNRNAETAYLSGSPNFEQIKLNFSPITPKSAGKASPATPMTIPVKNAPAPAAIFQAPSPNPKPAKGGKNTGGKNPPVSGTVTTTGAGFTRSYPPDTTKPTTGSTKPPVIKPGTTPGKNTPVISSYYPTDDLMRMGKAVSDRRRRDNDKDKLEEEFGAFRVIKTQRLDHFGIYDPLEFVGRGSMTRRETRKGKALSEVTTFKRTIYEDAGGYTTRKPKGKTRR